MNRYQVPSAWNTVSSARQQVQANTGVKQAPAKAEQSGKKSITAKIDMSEDVAGAGLCPACKKPMRKGFLAGSVPVMVCFDDRVTLPIPDAELEKQVESNSETSFLGVSFVDN